MKNVRWNSGDTTALKLHQLDNMEFKEHKKKCSLSKRVLKKNASVLYRKGMMIMLTFINDKINNKL